MIGVESNQLRIRNFCNFNVKNIFYVFLLEMNPAKLLTQTIWFFIANNLSFCINIYIKNYIFNDHY